MEFEVGYGGGVQRFSLPREQWMGTLMATPVEEKGLTGEAAVEYALDHPINSPALEELVRPGQKVVIVTSDISRPMPSCRVLPSVLKRLEKGGVSMGDVTVVLALGSHREHTEAEQKKLVGEEVYRTVRCEDSTATGFVRIGTTSFGTPVDIARRVAEADVRICLGNIEYHYFAGYSGGGKAIMPGVSTPQAIQSNHSRMLEAAAVAGNMAGNPIREDIEEAAALCGVDFILNVVLDEHKEIVCAVAGDVVAAHREGCRFLDRIYKKEISCKADIVVASQGGAPKDLNLYQVQKALENAKYAVKEGGVIILVGACTEGFGSKTFQEWFQQAEKPADLTDRIRREFRLGGHKAAAMAAVVQKADVYLVSQLPAEDVRGAFMMPFAAVQEALDAAVEKLGAQAKVLLMPYAGSTFPQVVETV